jgi:hypothetical protein
MFPQDILTFSQKLEFLLSHSHDSLPNVKSTINALKDELPSLLSLAFDDENENALFEVHKALFLIYETRLAYPQSIICIHQDSIWLLEICKLIESAFLQFEFNLIKDVIPPRENLITPESVCSWFQEQAFKLSNDDLLLMRFFEETATIDQFNQFILTDATLNYRFFDTLALNQVYISESVKLEITRNMWDECGNGVSNKSHTQQLTDMLSNVGLIKPEFPVWSNWRPYSGYNLHFCFVFNRRYHFRGIASSAMPEIFDPVRNKSIVAGLERLYPDARSRCEYFYNHIEIDVEHGLNWLKHVIYSIVSDCPLAGIDLVIGGAMRMEVMRRYNYYLASLFGLGQPEETMTSKWGEMSSRAESYAKN